MQQIRDAHDVLCREAQADAARVHQALQQRELSTCDTQMTKFRGSWSTLSTGPLVLGP